MRHVTENILGEVYYISFREEKEDEWTNRTNTKRSNKYFR
jgi:hypothetical protein